MLEVQYYYLGKAPSKTALPPHPPIWLCFGHGLVVKFILPHFILNSLRGSNCYFDGSKRGTQNLARNLRSEALKILLETLSEAVEILLETSKRSS